MVPHIWLQSITQDLPSNNGEGHISYGPRPCGLVNGPKDPQDSQHVGQFGPWGALVTPMDRILRRTDHTDHRTPKMAKGPKRDLNHKIIKMAIVMAKKPNLTQILKDNGEKPPPWMKPKVNQD
ncbi:hypothetical protein O181_129754 [Austropuccinia psidii MF-1]|uniref:Uncharacterized protein n=1 Tax=Austropuccinia psidii MF-1 TaxID=1389203 RepID=A0A9Q3KZN3_9BASI|nr:hypothetical protein [Austropuccinia psidii MF-1]